MAFLRVGFTPAGVPAVYEPRLAGTDLGEIGQTPLDDVLAALPDILKTGGDAAATIYRAVNPPTYPTGYAVSGVSGGLLGGSGLMLLAGAGVLLFALSKKRR